MMERITAVRRALGVSVIGIIVVAFLAACTSSYPSSSDGIVWVNDNTVQIQEGDTLVLEAIAKNRTYWSITYDGERTVRVGSTGAFVQTEKDYVLCGVGCTVQVQYDITLTERPDNRVDVEWPWGYSFYKE